ncbi:MAG: hypothetical protein IJ644_07750 [Oscillospiraceae bacterium]|nr:hypothetical protein [Oscillospiraceae bacterium]
MDEKETERLVKLINVVLENIQVLQERTVRLENQNEELQKKIESLEQQLKSGSSRVGAPKKTSLTVPPIPRTDITDASEFQYEKTKDGKGICIFGYVGFEKESIVIPDIIDDLPVKIIAPVAFINCTFLKKVYIPSSVVEIGGMSRNQSFEKGTVLYCQTGAYAIRWARDHGYKVRPAQEFSLD